MIGKALVGAAGVVISIGLATPAGANPDPPPTPTDPGLAAAAAPAPSPNPTPQGFLAAARAAGVTGSDPAMLGDGYDICYRLWNQQASGSGLAAGLVRDHPGLTTDEAAHFVLAAYNNLCPEPGTYDYWAYSTS